ncbi:MAG: CvpA family protein [Bacillota bacterium]|jgi:uncharacterized membrane protein required for colicin V production
MVTADWVLLAFSLLSILIGWNSGTIKILAGVGSLILGWQAARTFAAYLAGWLSKLVGGASSTVSDASVWNALYLFLDSTSVLEKIFYIVAFIIIFVLVIFIIRCIASALDRVMRGSVLGLLNSAVGAFFGLLIFAIIINFLWTIFLPLFGNTGVLLDLKLFLGASQHILPLLLGMTGYFITNAAALIDSFDLPALDQIPGVNNLPSV